MQCNLSSPSNLFGLSSSSHSLLHLFHHEKEVSHTKKQPNSFRKKSSILLYSSNSHSYSYSLSFILISLFSLNRFHEKKSYSSKILILQEGCKRKWANARGRRSVAVSTTTSLSTSTVLHTPSLRLFCTPFQRSKRYTLHNTREPPNLDSLEFKNKYGKNHSHFDPYRSSHVLLMSSILRCW
ncbi:uncharacterized protein DS421_1g10890 [Arachis hypogaea]|nr:uncharacterized protein DS421_1g10890 [Arachis hypogaea]